METEGEKQNSSQKRLPTNQQKNTPGTRTLDWRRWPDPDWRNRQPFIQRSTTADRDQSDQAEQTHRQAEWLTGIRQNTDRSQNRPETSHRRLYVFVVQVVQCLKLFQVSVARSEKYLLTWKVSSMDPGTRRWDADLKCCPSRLILRWTRLDWDVRKMRDLHASFIIRVLNKQTPD